MAEIVIVDDHQLLAESLRIALRGDGIDAVRADPTELPQLLTKILEHRPALVLLDLDLGPLGDATPLIAPLRDAGVRVVVVTGIVDRVRIAAALEQGAVGYRSKADGFDALLAMVKEARGVRGPLDPHTRADLLEELFRARRQRARVLAPFAGLTEREQQTLRLIAQGRSVHEIADSWVVSETTVRTFVRGVLAKLGVRSQLAAVAAARGSGWLDRADELSRA
jgi:DNA-binding NarL/FixJ family response regulator